MIGLHWAPANHVLAISEIILGGSVPQCTIAPYIHEPTTSVPLSALLVDHSSSLGASISVVSTKSIAVDISTTSGLIERLSLNGKDAVAVGGGPRPWLSRAFTDNDWGGGSFSYAYGWLKAGITDMKADGIKISLDRESADVARVFVSYNLTIPSPWYGRRKACSVTLSYRISGEGKGEVNISCDLKFCISLPSLPRVGLLTKVPKDFSFVEWLGCGPQECYPDRRSGALTGRYQSTAQNMHEPYIVPGESGGRCNVRWAALRDSSGFGLMLMSPPSSQIRDYLFNVSMYSEKSLQDAYHQHELEEDQNLNVYMDAAHMGVGGHDSWSPSVEKEFIVEPQNFSWSMDILPIASGDDAGKVALQRWAI